MPLHWSPPPHFCKVYKIQAPKHDTPLDAFGSNILSVVYAIKTYARQTHTARHLPTSCNKIKITEYL